MWELDQIEELFKSEEFAKSVNRHALNMLFRNTAIIRDPNLSAEQKAQAMENIKAIAHNLEPKPISSKPKKAKTPKQQTAAPKINKPTETVSTPSVKPKMQTAAPTASAMSEEHQFPEDFHTHHGVDPVKFKAAWGAMTPEQKKTTLDWHKEQVAAKTVKKSIDKLYALFETLKKQI
jgi:hypothetical protein